MSQCALQSWSVEDFFGLHITAPLAAKQLTIMRNNSLLLYEQFNRFFNVPKKLLNIEEM
jgi:hypothetical protein